MAQPYNRMENERVMFVSLAIHDFEFLPSANVASPAYRFDFIRTFLLPRLCALIKQGVFVHY